MSKFLEENGFSLVATLCATLVVTTLLVTAMIVTNRSDGLYFSTVNLCIENGGNWINTSHNRGTCQFNSSGRF